MNDRRYDRNQRGWSDERTNRRYEEARSMDPREERGFFERAGDEIASWFGDDDAERRRDRDQLDRGDRSNEVDRYDSPRYRDEGYRRPYTGRFTGGRGDDGRFGQSRYGHFDRAMGSQDERYGLTAHDPHYAEWRKRQIEDLDRDYDEYRRENQSRFESEFGQWRSARAQKRSLLGSVREHMAVIGSDGEEVGKVDHVRGDRIVLTKADSADLHHHAVPCTMLDRVENDQVVLDRSASDARAQFTSENRNRALFERDDERQPGPSILNRSFSGTY